MRRARHYPTMFVVTALVASVLAIYLMVPAIGKQTGVTHATKRPSSDIAKLSASLLNSGPSAVPCATLANEPNFVTIPTYPTSIASATVVAASNANPQYCDVKGMIAPQTQFVLELPTTTWNGGYIQYGCGGYCGTLAPLTFPTGVGITGDFAIATDDEGHAAETGLGGAGLFAFNDKQLREEYGYESEHALSTVAKTIIATFYGQKPATAYFDGCSDGGREAMEEAQRYPSDFTGIIAGAPEIIAGPLNAEAQTWYYKVNTNSKGDAILTDTKLPALHAAVIKQCSGDDGVADGIITTPRTCNFTPASIECPSGVNNRGCLTPTQVEVAREYYEGATAPTGKKLYPGGLPYGSELGWSVFELPPSQTGGTVPTTESLVYAGLSEPYLRFQLLTPGQLGPTPKTWQFTVQDYQEMFPAANTEDAMSTNLSAFRAHGGKLIMWQGWADDAIPPTGTVDYYEDLAKENGGYTATQSFARLFMVPTVYHCGGGYGGVSGKTTTMVSDLVQWSQKNVAPSQIDVNYTITSKKSSVPVYPYPDIPEYNGHGATPDVASSFHPVTSPAATKYITWIGNQLFYEPDGTGAPPGPPSTPPGPPSTPPGPPSTPPGR